MSLDRLLILLALGLTFGGMAALCSLPAQAPIVHGNGRPV